MKSSAHKSGSVLLAFLLLFSTLSFSMDMHFCGKMLVDYAFFTEASDCGMAMDDPKMADSDCCNDVEIVVLGQDDLEKTKAESVQGPQLVLVALLNKGLPMLLELDTRVAVPPFDDYSPPKLIRDLPVRHQVFLI